MANYYVNPSAGDNTNPGTELGPFSTKEHAMSVWSPGDTIFLVRGQDHGSLVITSQDGTAINRYNWDAYGIGTDPIISAFIDPGTGWVSEGGNLYSYTNASFVQARVLLITGERKGYGRWPKRATAEYYTINSASGNTSITDNTNLSGQPSYVGGELVSKKRRWTIDRSPITSQTSTTVTVTGSDTNYVSGNGYFIQNHQNACTENGEWAFDVTNDKIYLYSTTDPDTLDIKISFEQYAAHINNSDYHTFNNIIFEGAYEHNIYAQQSRFLTFNNCISRYAGINGLQTFVSKDLTWNNSAMYDINNHGISNRDASEGLTVTGSSFVRIASIPGMGASGTNQQCGIFINNTEHDNTLTGNYFFQIGNCGIYYRGNNSYVAKNYAEKCGFTVSDAAAFYTFGQFSTPYTNLICEENIAYDCMGNIDGLGGTAKFDTCGFYTDDNSKNVTVRNNYARKCGYCYYIHNNQDVTYTGNIGFDGEEILYLSDDNAQGSSTTLRIRNINVQNNIFKALAGQKLISIRTIGAFENDDPFLYGTINNNQLDAVDVEPFKSDLTFVSAGTYTLAEWRSTFGFDTTSNVNTYDDTKTIYLVNTQTTDQTFNLNAIYRDWDNVEYNTGEITLTPNQSILLFYVNNFPSPPPSGVVVTGLKWNVI